VILLQLKGDGIDPLISNSDPYTVVTDSGGL